MLFVLKSELLFFIKIAYPVSDIFGIRLVAYGVEHLLIEIISHQRKWLRLRWRGDLANELISVLVLESGLRCKNCIGSYVEHTMIVFL